MITYGAMTRLVALMLLVSGCSGAIPASTFPEAEIGVGDELITVWVADEPAERRQGLMEVDQLPRDIDGMLFVFEAETSVTFAMFNTPMPLDIWWFDPAGVLVGWAEMEPCQSRPCTSYRSPGPIRWVLETPRDKYDFALGAVISGVADATTNSN
ncbi:MAG: DUF192 domain-containing protein [Acidobacteria bacterium]|nr:DUF192 domain-containing protein [Acidobacteriota bacterium]